VLVCCCDQEDGHDHDDIMLTGSLPVASTLIATSTSPRPWTTSVVS